MKTTIPHSAPTIGEEETDAVQRVLKSGHLAQGAQVKAFEAECAEFTGRRHAIAVSSGTAALHVALDAIGMGPGSRIATPAYACAALPTAIRLQRATVVLCDVGEDYNLLSYTVPRDADAVILPHLFGAPASIPNHGVVIEDIAQSMGGPTGRSTSVAITSFYVTKLMTTGEGGMIFTDDDGLNDFARNHRDYDTKENFELRYNYKMTDFQAAMGRVQLTYLPKFIERRHAVAEKYLKAFANLPLKLPNAEDHIFFRFCVATDQRESLEAHLGRDGIEGKQPVHSPTHLYFDGEESPEGFAPIEHYPGADAAHARCLSLPIYPSMVDEQVDHVIHSVRAFFH